MAEYKTFQGHLSIFGKIKYVPKYSQVQPNMSKYVKHGIWARQMVKQGVPETISQNAVQTH